MLPSMAISPCNVEADVDRVADVDCDVVTATFIVTLVPSQMLLLRHPALFYCWVFLFCHFTLIFFVTVAVAAQFCFHFVLFLRRIKCWFVGLSPKLNLPFRAFVICFFSLTT